MATVKILGRHEKRNVLFRLFGMQAGLQAGKKTKIAENINVQKILSRTTTSKGDD